MLARLVDRLSYPAELQFHCYELPFPVQRHPSVKALEASIVDFPHEAVALQPLQFLANDSFANEWPEGGGNGKGSCSFSVIGVGYLHQNCDP